MSENVTFVSRVVARFHLASPSWPFGERTPQFVRQSALLMTRISLVSQTRLSLPKPSDAA